MTNLLLGLAAVVTLGMAIWLAFDNSAALALPLAVIFAGLVRTIVRRSGRRGITPAEVQPPSHDDRQR